jgi:ribosomal protein S18 acetylase RimI-like enzyme
MSNLILVPISRADHETLSTLLDEEERAWFAELAWDYAPVREILMSFMFQNFLPGLLALKGPKAVGYGYFLTHQSKGIIGTVYAPRSEEQQEAADEILAQMVKSLKELEQITRIESQILPFHDLNLTAGFTRHGFECYPRYFLELDLQAPLRQKESASIDRIIPWDASYLQGAAQAAWKSYQEEPDALICEDYCSIAGCENYLRSLVENPGCGTFQPDASFIGLDSRGIPCGFIICSRTSAFAGMIPQIAILPSHQGRGLGNALMYRALSRLKAMGMRTVSLTVTKKNRRAFEWYQRIGFGIRKEFNAHVWQRG